MAGLSRTAAILAAAGKSQRMGDADKIVLPLRNRPLIEYPLRVFDSHQAIALIVVVVSKSGRERLESCVRGFGLETEIRFTLGGVRRQDSVEAGMRAAPDADWLVIHDAARPFIDEAMIDRGLKAAEITGAAVAGIRCRDTVKLVDSERTIRETVDRDSLWMIQTPQIFRRELLAQAFETVSADVTDEAGLLEARGREVKVFEGSSRNVKVTTPDDIVIAESLAADMDALA